MATLLLFVVVCFPVLATLSFNSVEVNFFFSVVQLFFCLFLAPEVLRESYSAYKHSIVFRVCLLLMIVMVMGWFYLYIPFYGIYRSLLYLIQIPFFFSVLAWFRVHGSRGLQQIYYAKLIVVLLAILYMAYMYWQQDIELWRKSVKGRPPIYRHIRHFNYDLALLIGLSAWLIVKDRFKPSLVVVLFFLFGFLTFWSGARGQMLSLGVFLGLLMLSPHRVFFYKKLRVAGVAFLCGAIVLLMSGETHMLLSSMVRSVELESLRAVTSNRTVIWLQTLPYVNESWLFGYGPEAFLRLKVRMGGIVQPHNFVVQFLLEFGVVGSFGVMIMLLSSFRIYITSILTKRLMAAGLLGAFLISQFVFALVDGIFYHIVPLTMYLIIAAYLYQLTTDCD
ncbi:O-antigen ligase family protein [Zhongshania aliphaticivorans]|nr:O-antigen ligase family protein [Zhongshania aliphaticivorans]